MPAPAFLDDITLDELERDPYPIYARLRREAPVAWIPAANVWFVTRFDDCASVGEGDHGFVGASNHPTLQRVFGAPNVLTSDGEEHKDLRRGVDPKFQPNPVNEMVDRLVRPVARRYIHELEGRTSTDLMASYFEPVSVESLRQVMGLDGLVDAHTLRRWFHDLNIGVSNFGLDPEAFEIADLASAEIEEVIRPKLASLEKDPDDSMLSHMLWAGRPEGQPRPVELIMPSLKVILLGGMQEPGHAAGSALLGLFSRPEQLERLRSDPAEYIPLAVNEGLRWIAPIGAVERKASREVTLRDNTIPAGSILQVILASANRDETRYDDPDVFDMDRSTRISQAFGNGEHFCAGHFFARQVQRIMFEELIPSLPGLRLDPEGEPQVSGWVFRAPKTLPCVWEPAHDIREQISITPVAVPNQPDTRALSIVGMRMEALRVVALELADPDGAPLPAWTPGAHIDVWLSSTQAEQYSLCGDPDDLSTYRVAVLLEPEGDGGSKFVHEYLRPGMLVHVGAPRNNFALKDAESYTFVAGGIGVTAIVPMLREVSRRHADVTVVYAGHSRKTMAFVGEISAIAPSAAIHVAEENNRADLGLIIRTAASRGSVVYACGPERMLEELQRLGDEFGVEVEVERFTPGEAHRPDDTSFTLVLARANETLTIPADRTALDVLEENGYEIRRSCREGNCGSCEQRVLAGRVDHRDVLLTPKQRALNDRMMVCVSRAEDDSLTIDI
jgi:cytochrome P450/ferredoxin-NADP reductase